MLCERVWDDTQRGHVVIEASFESTDDMIESQLFSMTVVPKRLPKVVENVCNEVPTYLQYENEMTKTGQNSLDAAFEDIFSQRIDWSTYESLNNRTSDHVEYCKSQPITVHGVSIHVLAIAHSSLASCDHVKAAISSLAPSYIALESDVERTFGRRKVQLPVVRDCDFSQELADFGGPGPSLSDLTRVGLVDRKLPEEAAHLLAMLGSFTGAPELTCMHKADTANIPIASVDLLERFKRVQNVSLESQAGSTRKIGELPESILRMVTDDQGILRAWFKLAYQITPEAASILPTTLHRLTELESRSTPADDFLLRELHRIFRPREYFSRIFLRDVYMAARVSRLAKSLGSSRILVVCGAAHAEGVRKLLSMPQESLQIAAAASLLQDGELLMSIWRDIFGLQAFEPRLPMNVGVDVKPAVLRRLLIGPTAILWNGQGWSPEALPSELLDRSTSDEEWWSKVEGKYDQFWQKLLDSEAYTM